MSRLTTRTAERPAPALSIAALEEMYRRPSIEATGRLNIPGLTQEYGGYVPHEEPPFDGDGRFEGGAHNMHKLDSNDSAFSSPSQGRSFLEKPRDEEHMHIRRLRRRRSALARAALEHSELTSSDTYLIPQTPYAEEYDDLPLIEATTPEHPTEIVAPKRRWGRPRTERPLKPEKKVKIKERMPLRRRIGASVLALVTLVSVGVGAREAHKHMPQSGKDITVTELASLALPSCDRPQKLAEYPDAGEVSGYAMESYVENTSGGQVTLHGDEAAERQVIDFKKGDTTERRLATLKRNAGRMVVTACLDGAKAGVKIDGDTVKVPRSAIKLSVSPTGDIGTEKVRIKKKPETINDRNQYTLFEKFIAAPKDGKTNPDTVRNYRQALRSQFTKNEQCTAKFASDEGAEPLKARFEQMNPGKKVEFYGPDPGADQADKGVTHYDNGVGVKSLDKGTPDLYVEKSKTLSSVCEDV